MHAVVFPCVRAHRVKAGTSIAVERSDVWQSTVGIVLGARMAGLEPATCGLEMDRSREDDGISFQHLR
jgi:hypothetical protein